MYNSPCYLHKPFLGCSFEMILNERVRIVKVYARRRVLSMRFKNFPLFLQSMKFQYTYLYCTSPGKRHSRPTVSHTLSNELPWHMIYIYQSVLRNFCGMFFSTTAIASSLACSSSSEACLSCFLKCAMS